MGEYITRIDSAPVAITGDTLEQAVIAHFAHLAKKAGVGNGAGYRLVRVSLEPSPHGSTIGGKPYTMLHIDARGADLAHRPAAAEPKRTTIYFTGRHIETVQDLTLE